VRFTLNPSSVSATYFQNETRPVLQTIATASGNLPAQLYIGAVDEGTSIDPQITVSLAGQQGTFQMTPKAGLASIPVYGRAYPSSVSTATLGYTIPAGQTYVAKDLVGADYYSASTYNAPETYSVLTGPERFYEISFNHRLAFVRATDVDVVS